MAHDVVLDDDLVALDANHLFEASTTMIGCRRGTFLRGYMYEFIEIFAPHLNRKVVDDAFERQNRSELEALFTDIVLPSK
jgi:LysR family cys regulon transcriptional activator